MDSERFPWTFEKGKNSWDADVIRDADGNSILGSAEYYPWVPSSKGIEFIVAAVNFYAKHLNQEKP